MSFDSGILLPGLILLLLLGALGLGLYLWLRRVPEPALPAGSAAIRTRGAQRGDRSGRIMLVLIGTFAENLGSNLLTLLERCGLDGSIGSILLVEMDSNRRQRFLSAASPSFANRIVATSFGGLAGGLGNRGPDDVWALRDRWGAPIHTSVNQVCEVHQRENGGEEPALMLVFVSQGGQAIMGTMAVEAIRRQFPLIQAYGFSGLPVDDRLRSRTSRVLDEYRKVGVHGFTISDNLLDPVRNDFGMVATVAGFAAAAENADASVEQNNAWYLLFEEAPGGLVSYSTYVRQIPGFALPAPRSRPPLYYANKSSVVNAIQTGLGEVQHQDYDSILRTHGEGPVPMTSRFDIVLTAIVPDDLKDSEDDVLLGQTLKRQDKRNYHLLFAPITTQVDPARILCPVAVVSLQAVSKPEEILQHLTTPAHWPELAAGSTNGHAAAEPVA